MATVASPLRSLAITLESPYRPEALAALVERHGSPLLIIDCGVIRHQFRRLAAALPGVDLHYALKPLPERPVVEVLAEEGAWFDLATNGEVDLVRAAGVGGGRCIHTHPIKRDSDIRYAVEHGIRHLVADNSDEITKFAPYAGRTALLLRVSFRNPDAVCDLSRKFGCDPESAIELLRLARSLGVDVAGLSFHVGSQAATAAMHVQAIEACAAIIAAAEAEGLGPLGTLDIGGGFPIGYDRPALPIGKFCAPIRAALARLPGHVRVIAEPGRYICGPAGTCIATVMGRAFREAHWWYYLDDGLYGSFSGELFDHAHYPVEPLTAAGPLRPSVLAGPTCDSIDVIAEDVLLPELRPGDLVVGRMMGAYTAATATDFNFFPRAHKLFVNR